MPFIPREELKQTWCKGWFSIQRSCNQIPDHWWLFKDSHGASCKGKVLGLCSGWATLQSQINNSHLNFPPCGLGHMPRSPGHDQRRTLARLCGQASSSGLGYGSHCGIEGCFSHHMKDPKGSAARGHLGIDPCLQIGLGCPTCRSVSFSDLGQHREEIISCNTRHVL